MFPMCWYFLSRASGNSFRNTPRRLLVFADSLDSVAVLNSLHASKLLHNSILLAIAEIVMKTRIDLRVHHIVQSWYALTTYVRWVSSIFPFSPRPHILSSKGSLAGAMDPFAVNLFGGNVGLSSSFCHSRPVASLSDLDDRLAFL